MGCSCSFCFEFAWWLCLISFPRSDSPSSDGNNNFSGKRKVRSVQEAWLVLGNVDYVSPSCARILLKKSFKLIMKTLKEEERRLCIKNKVCSLVASCPGLYSVNICINQSATIIQLRLLALPKLKRQNSFFCFCWERSWGRCIMIWR